MDPDPDPTDPTDSGPKWIRLDQKPNLKSITNPKHIIPNQNPRKSSISRKMSRKQITRKKITKKNQIRKV